jgi:energy-converting hydrogenase Eha subunit C
MTSSPAPRSRALLYWGLAAAALAGGYLDLARGGETLAPILLVVGYLVLVPVAILKG